MAKAPETRYVKSGDAHIAYQVVGDGPIDLLYIPGWTYTHVDRVWEWPKSADYLSRLASFCRLILFDKRGIGASDRGVEVPTIENHLDDVTAVLDAAGSERSAIFGFSEGGPLALLFAATYPERVSAVVTYGAFPKFLRSDDYPLGIPERIVPGLRQNLESAWGTGAELALFAPSKASDPEAIEMQAKLTRAAASPAAAVTYFDMLVQIDVRDVLPTVQTPTLVVHRRDDRAVFVAAGQYLADHIPGARLEVMEGEDHIPWFGDYDDLIALVQEFLTGAKPPPTVDRVLATVLFSDLVGSTKRSAELGDASWAAMMDRINAAVSAEIERHQGRLIKTMGDGHLATFDVPARAIRAAQAIRDAIRPFDLQNRAALHTGEISLGEEDIGGIGVAIGSRIESLAQPGEILVSRTLTDLVVGSGFSFESKGTHELKGVPGTWEVFSVTGGGA